MLIIFIAELQECHCDHSQNEKCTVCVRVQSPQVYRLDFTDETEDQSAEQEVADIGHHHDSRSDNEGQRSETVNKDKNKVVVSSDNTENSTNANCDEFTDSDTDKLVTNVSDKNVDKIVCDSNKVADSLSSATVNAETKRKQESAGKSKKGTKSKDIWTDSGENRVSNQAVRFEAASSNSNVAKQSQNSTVRKPETSVSSGNRKTESSSR